MFRTALSLLLLMTLSALPMTSAIAEEVDPFAIWLADIKRQALERGIREETLTVLDGIEQDPRVVRFDRSQPEFTQTFEEYLQARVTKYRVDKAREYYRDHQDLLQRIAEAYGVDAPYLVAFWGLESNFGQYQGKYSVVRSLATLGYDPRRSTFFTRELLNALQILDEGHISREDFVGGWAGAMGQNQFIPSSFLTYAQDFDGDGRKDIWSTQADVWASIANYLKKNGWKKGATWGLPVKLESKIDFSKLKPEKTPSGCRAYRYHTRQLTLNEWKALGVRVPEDLDGSAPYAMVTPEDGETRAYLVGPNFRGILSYNCANKYAVSVGLMVDHILAPEGESAAN